MEDSWENYMDEESRRLLKRYEEEMQADGLGFFDVKVVENYHTVGIQLGSKRLRQGKSSLSRGQVLPEGPRGRPERHAA